MSQASHWTGPVTVDTGAATGEGVMNTTGIGITGVWVEGNTTGGDTGAGVPDAPPTGGGDTGGNGA